VTILKGTHGTCASFAAEIKKSGFKSHKGRGGTGIYFWAYESPSLEYYAKELAESWWMFSKHRGDYDGLNVSCVVIYVELRVENIFLDLEELKLKEKLIEFANKVYRRKGPKSERVSGTYDLFVSMMEQEIGVRIDVVHLRVAPPSKDFYRPSVPIDITGGPSCYVVRNQKVISPIKFEAA
jgi:hypothetical protein